MLETLPWLAGIGLVTEGGRVQPIPRMPVVAQLLADAQFAAQHLYRAWQVVSLARLESDNEIEVTTRDNVTVVFSAKGTFMQQLANLDFMAEKLSRLPPARVHIDLSLGREVPVRIEPLTENAPASKAVAVSFSPSRPPSNKREL
jgi:cell division protein FtsQ